MKQGWEIKKLGEIASISPSKSEVKTFALNPMDKVSFLPMEDLSIGKTFVHPYKQKTLSEVEGSYTYFKEGDVLLAKVTPCFENGKLAIAKDLSNNIGFGSSEYIVIRPMQHIVNSQYLLYSLQTDTFRNGGRALMIGACGLKRLPKPYVANYEIPIPSLAEQERIVEILDREFERIDAIKANAEQSLQLAKDLFQSALRQELQPQEGWETKTLKQIGNTQTGTTPKTANKDYYGSYIPFIKPADVNIDGLGGLNYANEGLSKLGASAGRVFDANSILMVCIGATIGKVGYADRQVSSNQQINVLTPPHSFNSKYLYYYMTSSGFQQMVIREGESAKATLPIINKSKWENLSISYPCKDIQDEIVSHLDELNKHCKALEENYTKTIALCDDMKQALLRKAFNGEL